MSKFKVGDKVKVIDEQQKNTSWMLYCECKNRTYDIGGEFVVDSVKDEEVALTYKGVSIDDGYHWYASSFELIKEYIFKVGDKIKSLESDCDISEGTIYTIIEGSNNGSVHFRDNDGYSRNRNASSYELVESPKEKLIEINMDIEDIKEFPKDVLVQAEKDAKEELAKEQADIAKIAFKNLLGQISDAEVEVAKAQKKLTDLRGKAKIGTTKKK